FRLPTARQPLVVTVCGRDIHGALPLKPAPWKKPYDAIMTRKCLCPAPFVRSSHCREFLTSARIRLCFAMSQSTTILFFLRTSRQRCASAWMKSGSPAGLLPIGSTFAARNFACTSGVLITSTAALAMSEANAGAVFGGAASANQPVDTRPGKPASAVVGISGSTGERRGSAIPQNFTPPPPEGESKKRLLFFLPFFVNFSHVNVC